MSFKFLRLKQKDKFFLSLDIGTEAIKTLIFKKNRLTGKDNKKIIILGASRQYFKKSGVFEKEILKKTILKAIKKAQEQAKVKIGLTLLSLPPTILKGRIVFQFFERKGAKEEISEKEEKIIYNQILRSAQKKISQKFAEEFGILPQDIQKISLKLLTRKIDGYSVPIFQGYRGKILEFKILGTFLPKDYLGHIKKTVKDLGLRVNIVYPFENLSFIQKVKKDVILLDVGGEVTQIFLIKNNNLQQIDEFGMGGKIFSQSLSDTLGVNEERARSLKERYSNKLLSPEARERIKEILTVEQRDWYENLKSRIKKMEIKGILPSTIFLLGGGSQVPEIQDSLKRMGDKIKFIFPKDLKDIEDKTKTLKSPQDVPSLLISYCTYG